MPLAEQFKHVKEGDAGVIGDPVEHSLSPVLQNAAFNTWKKVFEEDGKKPGVYHKFHVKPNELALIGSCLRDVKTSYGQSARRGNNGENFLIL